jgi:superfamily II DNA or RNA helicase
MTITIERTRMILDPYVLGCSPTLEKKLSVFDIVERKYTDKLFLYDQTNKRLYVPKGMGIIDLGQTLENDDIYEYKIVDKAKDTYIEPRTAKIVLRPTIEARDEHQKRSIEFLLKEDNPQKFLNIDTGFGKTFCSLAATAAYNCPVLILVHSIALMMQWEKVIKEYTFTPKNKVIRVAGSDMIVKILKNKPEHTFYICSIHTLSKLAKEGTLDIFLSHIKCGIKITDEAHKLYVSNAYIDLMSNIKLNYYLTATPQRSHIKQDAVYIRITKAIPKFGEYTVELNKNAHVKNVFINTFPSNWDQIRCRTQQGFSALKYEDFVFRNPRRKLYFILIAKRLVQKMLNHDPECKILILLSKNSHISFMAESLKTYLGLDVGQFNSLIKNIEEKRKQLKKNIIISTVQSSGDGLDLKDLRCIIVFTPFKSGVTVHQLLGRLRRIEGKAIFYFNIIDEGFQDCIRQANLRANFLRKQSKSYTNIDMSMNDVLNEIKGLVPT